MSQLNSFRFLFSLLVLFNLLNATTASAANVRSKFSEATISSEIYRHVKDACARIQDEEHCIEMQRTRDCHWDGRKCKCVPDEVALQKTLVSSLYMVSAVTCFLGGATLLLLNEPQKLTAYRAIVGGALMSAGGWVFSRFHLLREEYRSLTDNGTARQG